MSPLMDRRQRHVTATGLFLLLSLALVSVGARMGSLVSDPADLRDRLEQGSSDFKSPPFFTLTDRHGTVLAWSVEVYSLEASPFHLWLGHTPELILEPLADTLGLAGDDRLEFERDLLGTEGDEQIRVRRWPLTLDEAERIALWARDGGPGSAAPLEGLRVRHVADWPDRSAVEALEAAGRGKQVSALDRRRLDLTVGLEGPFYELEWSPRVLLSAAVRERACPSLTRGRGKPTRWTNVLAGELFDLLEAPRERERRVLRAEWESDPRPPEDKPVPRGYELASKRVRREGFLAGLRDLVVGPAAVPAPDAWVFVGPPREWVFDGLMPRRYVELVDELPADRVEPLRQVLFEQELSEYELWLEPTSRREYPAGQLSVLGDWEWWSGLEAEEGDDPVLRPTRGLENLGYVALREVERTAGDPRIDAQDEEEQEDVVPGGTEESTQERGTRRDPAPAPHLVAGRADRFERVLLRPRRPGEARDYYLGRGEGLAPATITSSLDLELQERMTSSLEQLIVDQQAALAMGVAIDLESREVLALDWATPYASMAFPPLQHGFTPGSTFKLVTAALALELDLVDSNEVFDVGNGAYVVRERTKSGRVRTRTVREAEGFATGRITAAECVAFSSNAGMIQIGHRVSVDDWKRRTAELGYGRRTLPDLLAAGLLNQPGRVGESEKRDKNAWSLRRSHTSVPFGDSVTTNLLQHAQALCALLDDGRMRPLRFLRSWSAESSDASFEADFAADPGVPVVRPDVARELRAMMRLGASRGTGKRLERSDELVLHTKTGTTEKLASDVCAHAYWGDYARCLERGEEWDDAERRALYRGRFRPGKSCYVSSICALAPSPTDGRPMLVLVVVDDPHGESHFGSKVAGPTAVAVLEAGLGLASDADRERRSQHSVQLAPAGVAPWDPLEVRAAREASFTTGGLGE